ncbi:MAG: hypothetical protein GYB67_01370 [Chloroflexi bacterium]|nr:hypothetical protein [Chloroflexota bacterium]
MRRWWLVARLAVLICGLAACEPEVTPLPVNITPVVSATPDPATAAPSAIRYVFARNTAGHVADLDLIAEGAVVNLLPSSLPAADQIDADLGMQYDVLVAFGDLPGGQRSPVDYRIVLVIDPMQSPLNDPGVADVIRASLDARFVADAIPGAEVEPHTPADLTDSRVRLANAGWPDGFDVAVGAAAAPGALELAAQLEVLSIGGRVESLRPDEALTALQTGQIQMAIVALTSPEARAAWVEAVGADALTDLYSLPISYRAMPELQITFTPMGWPLASR